jgi:hypothetical protein
MNSLPDAEVDDAGAPLAPRGSKWKGRSVYDVLKFLKASAYIKDLNKLPKARVAFRELENQIADNPSAVPQRPGKDWNHDSLRKARVKIDATAMRVCRAFIHSLPASVVFIQLYVDSSPQWRGAELFATSFDLIVRSVLHFCERRLMPQISIGPVMYSAVGKAYAMLWQVFLVAGPDYNHIRQFLDHVTVVLSDFGTERLIIALPDFLPEWCEFVGLTVPARFERRARLLPNSILSPGWHHIFDGLVRYGLYNFLWFPSWLLLLKLLLKFCRFHCEDLCTYLVAKGKHGAAAILKAIKFTTFAVWRWRKLASVTKSLRKAFEVSTAIQQRFLISSSR